MPAVDPLITISRVGLLLQPQPRWELSVTAQIPVRESPCNDRRGPAVHRCRTPDRAVFFGTFSGLSSYVRKARELPLALKTCADSGRRSRGSAQTTYGNCALADYCLDRAREAAARRVYTRVRTAAEARPRRPLAVGSGGSGRPCAVGSASEFQSRPAPRLCRTGFGANKRGDIRMTPILGRNRTQRRATVGQPAAAVRAT